MINFYDEKATLFNYKFYTFNYNETNIKKEKKYVLLNTNVKCWRSNLKFCCLFIN